MLTKFINFTVAILFLLSGVNLPSASSHTFAGTQFQLNERKSTSTLNNIAFLTAAFDEDENDELEEHVAYNPLFGEFASIPAYSYHSFLSLKQAVIFSSEYACIPVFLRNCSIRC